MSKKLPLCLFLLIFVISFAFASATSEEKIETVSNEIKVVSLAPNVTEIICALGAQNSLIGRTTYCNYPESVASIQDIGDLYAPNIELIVSLKPDAVIASSIVSPEIIEKLNNYGINTYQFNHENEGLDGTFTLINEIGEITNRTSEAEILVMQLKEKEAAITSKTSKIAEKERKTCAILVTWGEWGDYAATKDTFLDDLITKAGGINIASEAKYWAISKELMIAKDPDCIFMTDTANYVTGDLCEAFRNTEPYSILSASKNNKLYILDTDSTSRQSIRLFDVMETVAKTLYPSLFN